MSSYIGLQEKKAQIVKLEKEYSDLQVKTEEKKKLAERLKNPEYVEKYARAKYYYSVEGETIYPVPSLLPK